MFKSILFSACACIIFTGCMGGEKKEEWNSFIYPDKENTKRNLKSPMYFESLQVCKDESVKQLATMGISETGTYKCGLNCEFHDGMKLEVCETMLAPTEK